LIIALAPTPEGLSPRAWSYFALFVTVLIAIITEPIPAPAVGLAGVVAAAMLGLVQPTPALSIAALVTLAGGLAEVGFVRWLADLIEAGPLEVAPRAAALGLGFTLGILTPYATGPAPVYYTCGYIRKRDFWWFGLVMGSIFLGGYLLIGLPWPISRM
jgi:di/tricarboxylate transporter